MKDGDYDRLLTDRLRAFRKPGERIDVGGAFLIDEKNRINCYLCDWPNSSPKALGEGRVGLRRIVVLTNTASKQSIAVGSDCAKMYRRYLEATDSGAGMAGLDAALQTLQRGGARRVDKQEMADPWDGEGELSPLDELDEAWEPDEEERAREIRAEFGLDDDFDEEYGYYQGEDEPGSDR